jgi:hypothetical protein
MGDPNPIAAWLLKRALFLKVWMAEHVLADPRDHAHERARALGDVQQQHRTPALVEAAQCPFHAHGKTAPVVGSCPFH